MENLTDLEARRILGYLQQQRAQMEQLLQRLALVESRSGDREGLDRMLTLLATELKSAGMSAPALTPPTNRSNCVD